MGDLSGILTSALFQALPANIRLDKKLLSSTNALSYLANKLECSYLPHFLASLVFTSKARSIPIEWDTVMCSTWIGLVHKLP